MHVNICVLRRTVCQCGEKYNHREREREKKMRTTNKQAATSRLQRSAHFLSPPSRAHTALLQSSGPVLMKLLFLKGAEHELCRFVFTWGGFSPSPPHSSKPAVFYFSSDSPHSPPLFHSFKTDLLISNASIFFFPLEIMSPPKKNCKSPSSPPACCPPGLPTLLLSCSLLNPLTLFPSLYLSPDVAHTRAHTHISLSLSHHLSIFPNFNPVDGVLAEGRKGRGPGAAPAVSDSHKCVKEEKRKSYSLSSAPVAPVSPLKTPVTNVRAERSHQIV